MRRYRLTSKHIEPRVKWLREFIKSNPLAVCITLLLAYVPLMGISTSHLVANLLLAFTFIYGVVAIFGSEKVWPPLPATEPNWRFFSISSLLLLSFLILLFYSVSRYTAYEARLSTIPSDYRSLGWITFGGAEEGLGDAGGFSVPLQLWLGDANTQLHSLQLTLVSHERDGGSTRTDFGTYLRASGNGSNELKYRFTTETSSVTACLSLPIERLDATYTVVQTFDVVFTGPKPSMIQKVEPQVTVANGPAARKDCS